MKQNKKSIFNMREYIKETLDYLQGGLEEKERKRDYKLYRNEYIAKIFSYMFYYTGYTIKILFYTGIILCVMASITIIIGNNIILATIFMIISVFLEILCGINMCISFKSYNKGEKLNKQDVLNFKDKIYNMGLLDNRVISIRKIKNKNNNLYQYIKSEESIGYCYGTALCIANTLADERINMLLLIIQMPGRNYKIGHCILEKNGRIFESNENRTYKSKKYMSWYNAEVFTKIPISDYLLTGNELDIIKSGLEIDNVLTFKFPKLEKEFKEFCKQRSAYAYIDDIPELMKS